MVSSKKHRNFDYIDDENLQNNIMEKYRYFNQAQYQFSLRLNQKLVDLNCTNAEFATITGLSEPSISNYVTGKRMPRANELEIIAQKLFVPVDYLLGKTDCISFSAEEINKIIGLSEEAMKILCMLHHNQEEIEDLMDPMEISNVHKDKLQIFSSFIADISNFSMFLTYIESYIRTKQKISETNNDEEKELLKYDLLRN